jgi:hypothetical protein
VQKRRLLLIASLPLAIAVIIGVLVMLPPRPSVMKSNFDRIENGMKIEEIAKMLDLKLEPNNDGPSTVGIKAPDGDATIEFSRGFVVSKAWRYPTILDRIDRWLHLD